MKKIKYICFYNYSTDKMKRENVQSASTKIDYVVSVLNRNGISVDIISKSPISSSVFDFSIGGEIQISASNTLRHFISFGCRKNKLLYALSRALNTIHFLLWLLFNTKRGEQIIVYHSLGYTQSIMLVKKLKRIIIIGEIEEIYHDVHKQYLLTKKSEYEFIKQCDKYIFPNTVLNEKINTQNRPYLVVHGLYNIQLVTERKFDDGKIHVLYSGTFDSVKGGVYATLEMTQYLLSNYHVHITGFGNENQVKIILDKYNQIKGRAECEVTHHGFISCEELNTLMQKCHIGLCTQDPTKELNLTSYPSKILNYMSNGLVVLSGRNRAIEESAVGDLVYYYNEHIPEVIADAIMRISILDGDKCKERLRKLDKEFENNLRRLL